LYADRVEAVTPEKQHQLVENKKQLRDEMKELGEHIARNVVRELQQA
jgi:hypothetical protein